MLLILLAITTFCDNNKSYSEFIKRGGQRKLTVLVYFEEKHISRICTRKYSFYPLAKNSHKCHSSKKW